MQIFFDFSGYTDMAIGMALLMGFRFPVNFERPYLAFSITDFWHRWHMTLSRWLRDYLYIPLGGNRGGEWKTYRNLMATMLLGGLWHGASWNFVIWGAFHGTLLGLERLGGRQRFLIPPGPLLYPLRAILTFGLVCVGWVFFRAMTLDDSLYVIAEMFGGAWRVSGVTIPVWLLCLTLAALLVALLEEKLAWIERLSRGPAWAYVAAMVVLLVSVELIGVTEQAVPFVYFQF
jgi:alginate O-acetyltransferase complex protein AlgI